MAPANDVKTEFPKAKNRPKNVSKRRFFPILGTLKTGAGGRMILETLTGRYPPSYISYKSRNLTYNIG